MGNSAADRIPSDADVVVCQSVLAERIAAAAKGAELIVIDNFLSDPGLDALFVRLESAKPTAAGPGTVSCGESDSDMSDAGLRKPYCLPTSATPICRSDALFRNIRVPTGRNNSVSRHAPPPGLRKLRPLAVYPVPGPHNPHSLATNPVCGAPRPIRPRNPKKPHPPPRTPLRTAPSWQPGNIRVGLPAEPKEEAIRRAGELLVAGGYARPEYVDAMLRREKLATTCLGMGLAIPHGTSDAKERVLRSAS